jgi:hypothetical protein
MIRIAITAAGVIPVFVVCAPGADLVTAQRSGFASGRLLHKVAGTLRA